MKIVIRTVFFVCIIEVALRLLVYLGCDFQILISGALLFLLMYIIELLEDKNNR